MAKSKPKKGKPKITKASVEPLIEQFFGNLTGIATALRVSRQAVHKFLLLHSDLREQVDAEKERVKDLVERSLVKQAIDGDLGAICFYLKTQAKDRGYVERSEVKSEHSGRMVIDHKFADALLNDQSATIAACQLLKAIQDGARQPGVDGVSGK